MAKPAIKVYVQHHGNMMCDYRWLLVNAEWLVSKSNPNPPSTWGPCPTHTVVVDHPDGRLDAVPGHGTEELVRDGGRHGASRRPVPVPCLARRDQERAVRGVLRGDDRGDARAHVLPPEPVLGHPSPSGWRGQSARLSGSYMVIT